MSFFIDTWTPRFSWTERRGGTERHRDLVALAYGDVVIVAVDIVDWLMLLNCKNFFVFI